MIFCRYEMSRKVTPAQFEESGLVGKGFSNVITFGGRYGPGKVCNDFRVSLDDHWAVIHFHDEGPMGSPMLELEADYMTDTDLVNTLQMLANTFFMRLIAGHPVDWFPGLPRELKPNEVYGN